MVVHDGDRRRIVHDDIAAVVILIVDIAVAVVHRAADINAGVMRRQRADDRTARRAHDVVAARAGPVEHAAVVVVAIASHMDAGIAVRNRDPDADADINMGRGLRGIWKGQSGGAERQHEQASCGK